MPDELFNRWSIVPVFGQTLLDKVYVRLFAAKIKYWLIFENLLIHDCLLLAGERKLTL